MAKAKPKPRILFVCAQNAEGKSDLVALEVLRQLYLLLKPLEEQGQIDLWAEEPDSRVYLEDVLSQRPSRQFLTIIHVIGPLVNGEIRVRARNSNGYISSSHEMWAREEWPFLRAVVFTGSDASKWLRDLPQKGIPMVLSTGLAAESAMELYLYLMSGSPIFEAAVQFVDDPQGMLPLKEEGALWTNFPKQLKPRAVAYLEDKTRALSWRMRNPLLIPSSEKQWLLQQIRRQHEEGRDKAIETTPQAPRGPEARRNAANLEAKLDKEKSASDAKILADQPPIVTEPAREVLEPANLPDLIAPVQQDQPEPIKPETPSVPEPEVPVIQALENMATIAQPEVEVEPIEEILPEENQPEIPFLNSEPEEAPMIPSEESESEAQESQPQNDSPFVEKADPETIVPLDQEPATDFPTDTSAVEKIEAKEETGDTTSPAEPDTSTLVQLPPLFPAFEEVAPLFPSQPESKANQLPEQATTKNHTAPEMSNSLVKRSEPKQEELSSNAQKDTTPKQPKPASRPTQKQAKTRKGSPEGILAERDPETKQPQPAKREKTPKGKPSAIAEPKPVKPTENLPKPRRRSWLVLAIMVGLASIISVGIFFPGVFSAIGFGASRPENPCPFPSNGSDYRVLVLSFIPEGECKPSSLVHESVLVNQIKSLRQEGIHTDVRLLEVEDCDNREGKAQGIAASCGADLILWASYSSPVQSNSTGTLHYYLAETKYSRLFMKEQAYEESVSMTATQITGDLPLLQVSNLLYWYEALKQQELGNPAEATRYLEAMSPPGEDGENQRTQFLKNAYLATGYYGQAKRLYDNLIASNSQSKNAYIERADIFRRMGLFQASIDDYNRALELSPNDLESSLGLSMALTELGKYDEAIQLYTKMIQREGELGLVLVRRGDTYAKMGRSANALFDYDRALALNPQYAEAYQSRALLQRELGNTKEALADNEKALSLQPALFGGKYFLIETNLKNGAYDQALNQLNQLLEKSPEARAFYDRGLLLLRVNEPDRALADFTKAVESDPTYYEALMEQGKVFFSKEEYSKAEEAFNKVLRLRPAHALAYAWIGRSLAATGKADSALVKLDRAIELDPTQIEPILYQAETRFQIGQLDNALRDIDNLLARITPTAEAFFMRGKIQMARGQIYMAVADLDRAIRLNPSLADAYVARGEIKVRLKNIPGATADFDDAIRLRSQDPRAYLQRASLHIAAREFEPVLALYAKALELDSTQVSVFLARGTYLQRFHRDEQALKNFEKVISLNPDASPEVYLLRGNSLAALGRDNEALLDYNRVIRSWPDSVDAYCARGTLYQSMGKVNQAQEDFSLALKIAPKNPATYYSQGVLFAETGSYDRALPLFDQAIKLDRTFAKAYNRRGEVFFKLESYEQALSDFTKALELDSGLGRAYRNRADLARKVSEYDSAIRDYGQAILFDPTDADAFYSRGFLYAIQQKFDLAIPDIRRSLELDPDDGLRYGFLAKVYARQGKDELFYQNIEIALSKDYPLIELENDPAFKPYQNQARFIELMKRFQR